MCDIFRKTSNHLKEVFSEDKFDQGIVFPGKCGGASSVCSISKEINGQTLCNPDRDILSGKIVAFVAKTSKTATRTT